MFEKRNENKQAGSGANAGHDNAAIAKPSAPVVSKAAVIGAGININGDISGTEGLVIEGKVEGKINLPGHQVEVGKSGRVSADISAKYVKVEGELKGDIDGREKVVIAKSGNVRGNITAPRVMLEDGAIFKGSIDIDPTDNSAVELPVSKQKAADNVKPLAGDSVKKESGYTLKGG